MTDKIEGVKVLLFDAYGTLFDVHSAVGRHRPRLGEKADGVSAVWRTKHLEYTWLRTLMGRHIDFWQLTQDALDFALDTHDINDFALRQDLLDAYLQLNCYAEVPAILRQLRQAGYKTAILSNGSPMMLEAAVSNSGLTEQFDAVLSVETVGKFKPAPAVYRLAVDHFQVSANEILFHSSNAWDAAGAAVFGFRVAWINRFGQRPERLPGRPVVELTSLSQLPPLLS